MPDLNSFAHSCDRSFTVGDEIFMVNVCACTSVADSKAAALNAKIRSSFIITPLDRSGVFAVILLIVAPGNLLQRLILSLGFKTENMLPIHGADRDPNSG